MAKSLSFWIWMIVLFPFVQSKVALSPEDLEHPCSPDSLRETHRYFCTDEGHVICREGWREPQIPQLIPDGLRFAPPCTEPICDFEGRRCVHGYCIKPGVCSCDIGWEGYFCDECIRLPGCRHGTCVDSFECICEKDKDGKPLWIGRDCDQPACSNCENGQCVEPGLCRCDPGWTGKNCDKCETFSGCVHGSCNGKAHACECHQGYGGQLCDRPICKADCHPLNGYCEEPGTCLCKSGYMGPNCNACDPYWDCPPGGYCLQPHQCICNQTVSYSDTHRVCNLIELNGPRFGPWSECSNPCQEQSNVDQSHVPGSQIRLCRWNPDGPCEAEMRPCFGNRPWMKAVTDDPRLCHYVRSALDETDTRMAIDLDDLELQSCSEDKECLDPELSHCVDQACHAFECLSNSHCFPGMCQNGTCILLESCLDHSDCPEESSFCIEGHCRLAMTCEDGDAKCPEKFPVCRDNICQACKINEDCPEDRSACSYGMCHEKCQNDEDCTFPTPKCNVETGNCQRCLTTTDCGDDRFYCVQDQGKCKPGCDSDVQCRLSNAETPVCNMESFQCYECMNDAHCDPDHYCNGQYKCTSGCHHTYQCQKGQYCSKTTGQCSPGCNGIQMQCPEGTSCKENVCQPQCQTNINCPKGTKCQTGICQDGCVYHEQCPLGNICNESNQCIPGCIWSEQCHPGQICLNGTCTEGCDPEVHTCPKEQHCNGTSCVEGCNGMHERCPEGFLCQNEECIPGCNVDTKCPPNQYCRSNQCVDGCESDQNCDLEYTCNLPMKDCVAGCFDNDERCPLNYICDGSGSKSRCTLGCHLNSTRCERGYVCLESNGLCVPGCNQDVFPCPRGYQCIKEVCIQDQ